jgi:hypothetical protein
MHTCDLLTIYLIFILILTVGQSEYLTCTQFYLEKNIKYSYDISQFFNSKILFFMKQRQNELLITMNKINYCNKKKTFCYRNTKLVLLRRQRNAAKTDDVDDLSYQIDVQ